MQASVATRISYALASLMGAVSMAFLLFLVFSGANALRPIGPSNSEISPVPPEATRSIPQVVSVRLPPFAPVLPVLSLSTGGASRLSIPPLPVAPAVGAAEPVGTGGEAVLAAGPTADRAPRTGGRTVGMRGGPGRGESRVADHGTLDRDPGHRERSGTVKARGRSGTRSGKHGSGHARGRC